MMPSREDQLCYRHRRTDEPAAPSYTARLITLLDAVADVPVTIELRESRWPGVLDALRSWADTRSLPVDRYDEVRDGRWAIIHFVTIAGGERVSVAT